MSRGRTLAFVLLAVFLPSAAAATIWNEGVDGDLSSVRTSPTKLALSTGSNLITGSTVAGDVDFFTVSVPADTWFTHLTLVSYVSADDLSFLAIQLGPIITDTTSAASLLGWIHPNAAFVGSDILDNLGASNIPPNPAIGFTPPLPAGTYAMWAQQLQAQVVSYSFDLIVVPEPSVAALLAFGLCGLAIARRRA